MKKIKLFAFAVMTVLSVASVTYFNSCKKDPCKDVVCNNGGTCVDGTCSCTTGYEGTNCETEMRTKFIAAYNVSESKNSGATYNYTSSIASSSVDASTIVINGLANSFFNSSVKAKVSSTNSITIASQQPDNDGYVIAGTGAISGTTVTISYTITGLNGAVPPVTVTDNYSATFTKQ